MNMEISNSGEVLLISSNRELAGEMMDCVDSIGYILIAVESDERAISAFAASAPDAIFVDVESARRPGVLSRIKGNFPNHSLILVGSRYDEISSIISNPGIEKVDYIIRPLIPSILKSRITISSPKNISRKTVEKDRKLGAPKTETLRSRDSLHRPARPCIIVVDDEEEVVTSVKRYLDAEGYDVYGATTPSQALDLCAQRHLDIAFIDIDLIETTGNLLFEQMKEIQPDLKCVFITGRASIESAAEAVGADGVLSYQLKPFQMTRLNEFVIEAMIARLSEDSIRRYTDIINNIHTGLHVYRISEGEKDLALLDANPAAEKILNVLKNDCLGKKFSDIWSGATLGETVERIVSMIIKGRPYSNDNISLESAGRRQHLSIRLFSMPGRCVGMAFEDITEVRTAIQDLKIFKTVSDKAKIGTAICDSEGKIIYANSEFEAMHGFAKGEAAGKDSKLFHADSNPVSIEDLYAEIKAGGGFSSREIWRKKKDGTDFPTLLSATAIDDENNKTILIAASMSDITERLRSRSIIEESESRYRAVLNNMKHCVAVYKPVDDGADFEIVEFNKSAEEVEEISRDDIIGKKITETFPGVEEFGLLKIMKEVNRTGESEFFPASVYSDGQKTGWRENFVFKLSGGEIVCIYDEVTDRKKAELALLESEEHFRAQFKGFPAPTLLWKKRGASFELSNFNDAAERATGGLISVMIGASSDKMFEATPEIHEKIWECYHEMENHRAEFYFQFLSNEAPGYYEIHFVNLPPDMVMQTLIDLTEIREAEISIKNSEELLRGLSHRVITANEEERSRLSRELHDELGQQLTALRWGIENIRKHIDDERDSIELDNLKGMLTGATTELRRICRGLRPQLLDDMGLPLAVRALVESASKELNINIDLNMPDEEYSQLRDVVSETGIIIYRVLQEALTNAAKHARAKLVMVSLASENGLVVLSVKDDGIGFDPSSSGRGASSGLGITGMKERAALCGGNFSIISSPGKGAEVRLEIPGQES